MTPPAAPFTQTDLPFSPITPFFAMKLYALVTLFCPAPDVPANLLSYAGGVDGFILWDNTPGGSHIDWPAAVAEKIVDLREGPNVGIGPALNHAVDVCTAHPDVTHLLTMDQDSRFAPGTFAAYRRAVCADTTPDAGAYVPLINRPVATGNAGARSVEGFIVSGTIFPMATFGRVGRFEERFVIDMIDVDFAIRLRRAGLVILQEPSASLIHSLGTPLRGSFLGFHPVTLNYSPLRTYYITRNLIYLSRTVPDFGRRDLLRQLVWKRPFYILLMERRKGAKLLAWMRGLVQGWCRRLSPDRYAAQL